MAALPSGLPESVDDSEDVARFLTSRGHFNATMVKPAAFMPNPKDNAKSVYRHNGNPRAELWQIGQEHLPSQNIHGAAIVGVAVVREAGLDVAALEPPPRHANIVGWSTENDPELKRSQDKDCANLVAQRAARILKETDG